MGLSLILLCSEIPLFLNSILPENNQSIRLNCPTFSGRRMRFANLHLNKALSQQNSPGLTMAVPSSSKLPHLSRKINFSVFDSRHKDTHEFLPWNFHKIKKKTRAKLHKQAASKLAKLKKEGEIKRKPTFVTLRREMPSEVNSNSEDSVTREPEFIIHSESVNRNVERILNSVSLENFEDQEELEGLF